MKYYKDDFFKELIVDNFAGTALIRANCADMAYRKRLKTVAELNRAMSA